MTRLTKVLHRKSRGSKTSYRPDKFQMAFETRGGAAIWAFLNRPDNLLRMETATFLGRPAVEPLSPLLLAEFGDAMRATLLKQMVGHMVRQVMEQNGYRLERGNVKIPRKDNIFGSASRYRAAEYG
ncbi:MAG: hypothetical protein GY947_13785 [Rhodobacteraceae bacterium]|nr:hypothetical protein [Paracoccaceae bacterium]